MHPNDSSCTQAGLARLRTSVVVGATLALGGLMSACSLSGFDATPCDSDAQCESLFGGGSMCVDDFCTAPTDGADADADGVDADAGDAADVDTGDGDDHDSADGGDADACVPIELYVDGDGDGDGSGEPVMACPGDGYSESNDDCDDSNDAIGPSMTEVVGDGIDQDCDNREECHVDADGDGHRLADAATALISGLECTGLFVGIDAPADDCDDNSALRHGGLDEVCDGVDNDCNDQIDDGLTFADRYLDEDDDGFGSEAAGPSPYCDEPEGTVVSGGDCDDENDLVNPDADETVGDEIDFDCDGRELCYVDFDGDGQRRGDGTSTIGSDDTDCADVHEALDDLPVGDCDDEDDRVGLDFTEVCGDGVDNDCLAASPCRLDGDVSGGDAATSIAGADTDGLFGIALLVADYNDDGSADLIVGDTERATGGAVFVFFGPLAAGRLVAADADIEIRAPQAGAFGTSLAFAELTGDERADLIVGAPLHSNSRGAIYIVDPLSVTAGTTTLGAPDVFGSNDGDLLGTALASAGNPDENDCDEVLAGAPGQNVSSTVDAGVVYFFTCDGTDTPVLRTAYRGEFAFGLLGTSVAAVELDGRAPLEFVLGAPGATGAVANAGRVYVSDGPPDGASAIASTTISLYGATALSLAGQTVANAGDLNGDGLDELAIGAPGTDGTNEDSGALYIFEGRASYRDLDATSLTSLPRIEGAAADEAVGTAVAALGDADSDGFDDLVCYAGGSNLGGRTVVVYGDDSIAPVTVANNVDSAFVGAPGTTLGRVLAAGADLTGDGVADIILAAPESPPPDSGGLRGGVLIFDGASL